MASNTVQIFVRLPDGRNLAINLAQFSSVTVKDLMEIIENRTIMGCGSFRLIYGSHNLNVTKNDHLTTLSDYEIGRDATVHMVPCIRGGHMSIFRFADITKKDSFRIQKLIKDGPTWRSVINGLNFMGKCQYPKCRAYGNFVIHPKGFYAKTNGVCFLYSEIHNILCPECGNSLGSNTVCGIGVFNCKAKFECKVMGSDAVKFEVVARNEYKYAGCIDDEKKITYEYFIVNVTPLYDMFEGAPMETS